MSYDEIENHLANRFYYWTQDTCNESEASFQLISIPKFVNPMLSRTYDSDMTRNKEYLLMGGDQSSFIIYDNISQRRATYKIMSSSLQQPVTAVAFSYHSNFILGGTVKGSLLYASFHQVPINDFKVGSLRAIRSFMDSQIIKIIHLPNDNLLVFSALGFRVCTLTNLVQFFSQKEDTPKTNLRVREHIFPFDQRLNSQYYFFSDGITAVAYNGGSVVAIAGLLGQITLNDFQTMSYPNNQLFSMQIPLVNLQVITALAICDELKLLAVATGCIDVSKPDDEQIANISLVNIKKKQILQVITCQGVGERVCRIQFFSAQHVFVCGGSRGSLYIYEIETKVQTYKEAIHTDSMRGIFITNDDIVWPTIVTVGAEGKTLLHFFDAPKIQCLDYTPFVFWVEQNLQNKMVYSPISTDLWTALNTAMFGIEKRYNNQQRAVLLGDQYFKPLFDKILEHGDFQLNYQEIYKKQRDEKKKLQKLSYSLLLIGGIELGEPPVLLDKNISSKPQAKKEKRRAPPQKMMIEAALFSDNTTVQKEQLEDLRRDARQFILDSRQDDRFLLFEKLMNGFQGQGFSTLILSRCPMLFDERLGFFYRINNEISNIANKLIYVDLSRNNLDLKDACIITSALCQRRLKFLDFSFNRLGNSQSYKRQQTTRVNNDPQVVVTTFQHKMKNIFKAEMVSLRENGFTDQEGQELLQEAFQSHYLKVLDISGNLKFATKTLKIIQDISEQELIAIEQSYNEQLINFNKPRVSDTKVPKKQSRDSRRQSALSLAKSKPIKINSGQSESMDGAEIQDLEIYKRQEFLDVIQEDEEIELKKAESQQNSNQQQSVPIPQIQQSQLQTKNIKQELSQLGLVVFELNPTFCERGMKEITRMLVKQEYRFNMLKQNFNKELNNLKNQINEEPSQQASKFQSCYFFIINNKQNTMWDQSLLNLYEKSIKKQQDNIRDFFAICCSAMFRWFLNIYNGLANDLIPCLKQCFCSFFFVKKYILCCYCTFLQSRYGSWIQQLMGLTTADYEYNEKKEKLQTSLERYKYQLNILFWFNFCAFFGVVILCPIFFVLQCNGHRWYLFFYITREGHFIYLGYAAFVVTIETILALYCIKYDITHIEYTKGSKARRLFFFIKDIVLSQIGKFDVYSDMCFITIAFTCNTTIEIAICASIIMGINLVMVAYQVLKLLMSKMGGDENYIDYLCNYCSFLELHLVAGLLEKWTIQNTTDVCLMKGVPNRVYGAVFRTFAEDLPQFILQVIYLIINPKRNNSLILSLSLGSSIFSIIISTTKSLTITKANRINDQIMMNEVKSKLKIEFECKDPEFNTKLQYFLHDYYDLYDGNEEIQSIEYGLNDMFLSSKDRSKIDHDLQKKVQQHFKVGGQKGSLNSIFRMEARAKRKQVTVKGLTQLEENKDNIVQLSHKKTLSHVETVQKDDFFEVYDYFINSPQANAVKTLWKNGIIKHQNIAEILLQTEIVDFQADERETFLQPQTLTKFKTPGGSFIDCLHLQAEILNNFYETVQSKEGVLTILDCGCGTGYTTACLMRLCEILRPPNSYKILGLDMMEKCIQEATKIFNIFYQSQLDSKIVQFVVHDCRSKILDEYGEFDLVNVGFAVIEKYESNFENALKANGRMMMPQQQRFPSEHNFTIWIKGSKGDIFKVYDIQELQDYLTAPLTRRELQDHQTFEYITFERGVECNLCQSSIKDQDQYYCPWTEEYLCIDCGDADDEETSIQNFKYPYNLVFIPQEATENELYRVDSYKLGKNIQPHPAIEANKKHQINCPPCQREEGDESNFDDGPRFICLNCRPGRLEGRNLEICSQCGHEIITKRDFYMDQRLTYLSEEGHYRRHLMLKIHFDHGCNNY